MSEPPGIALLRERLPAASGETLAQLHALIRGGNASGNPFAALLQEGCSPAMIQSALFDYRDALLQAEEPGIGEVGNLIRRFDRLGFMLLQAVGGYWQGRLDALRDRLSVADDALQMAQTRARWLREGQVTLYNYFREVPVMARVRVYDVRETGMVVERSDELVTAVAAGQHGRFVHVRLPDLASCLRLEVKGCSGKRVNLGYAGTFKTERERRQQIRVMCDDGLSLTLLRPAGGKLLARVHDISRVGLGLRVGPSQLIKVNERLGFNLRLPDEEVNGSGSVRWLHRERMPSEQRGGGHTMLGIELELTPLLARRMQAEVAVRQKRALAELELIGVPDSMI